VAAADRPPARAPQRLAVARSTGVAPLDGVPIRAVALALAILLPHQQSGPPSEAARAVARADAARVRGRFDDAIAAYREALAVDPGYRQAHRGLGLVFDLTGRNADARTEYQSGMDGIQHTYEATPFLSSLATSYVFDRRFDEAHAALQEYADLLVKRRGADPKDALAFFDLAMASNAFDEADRRLAQFYGPITKPPAVAPLPAPDRHAIMAALEWMRYNAQRAKVCARRGQAAEARRFLAAAEAEAKELGDALTTFSSATGTKVGLDPGGELAPSQAEVAYWLGDTSRTIRLLADQKLFNPRLNLALGQAYERQHELAQARAAYARVVESTELSIDLAWARPIAQERLAAIGRP
jgi:tetratricopeptide (TPR) repeat protein